jgi:hypothetical protein
MGMAFSGDKGDEFETIHQNKCTPKGKSYRKENLVWTDDKIKDEVFEAMEQLNLRRMPTEDELRNNGFKKLVYGIKVYGGFAEFRLNNNLQSKAEYGEMVKGWKKDINDKIRSLMIELDIHRVPREEWLTYWLRSRIISVYGSYDEFYKQNSNIQRVGVRNGNGKAKE